MILLFMFFIVVPVIEITILIKVGGLLGVLNTILLLIGISVVGAWLTRLQGFLILSRLKESLSRGVLPSQELLDGAMILAAGVLLIVPGFFTDILGLILLLPPTRALIRYILKRSFKVNSGQVTHYKTFRRSKDGYDDIDV